MQQHNIFIAVAQHAGFTPSAAHRALTLVNEQLYTHGYSGDPSFYIYRVGQSEPAGGRHPSQERPRMLLAFPSADSALTFAQRNHLGQTPRLVYLSVAQLLAIILQRPSIHALIFVDELAETPPFGTLPQGFRLNRAVIVDILHATKS